jgi:hypothetical protein
MSTPISSERNEINDPFDKDADAIYRKLVLGYVEIYKKGPWAVTVGAIAIGGFMTTNLDKASQIAGLGNTEAAIVISGIIAILGLVIHALHNRILAFVNFPNLPIEKPAEAVAYATFFKVLRAPRSKAADSPQFAPKDIHEAWKPILWHVKASQFLSLMLYLLVASALFTFISGVIDANSGGGRKVSALETAYKNEIEALTAQTKADKQLIEQTQKLARLDETMMNEAYTMLAMARLALEKEEKPSRNIEVAKQLTELSEHALGHDSKLATSKADEASAKPSGKPD